MSDDTSYADIIILALIAGFILLRLRSILGDKTGHDHPGYFNKPIATISEKQEPVVQLDEKSLKPKAREDADPYMATIADQAITDTLNGIKTKDTLFTATFFLAGAKAAFEMAFDAFAKGDTQTLKRLMSDTLLQNFTKAIADRDAQDPRTETTLVSVQAQGITKATLSGNIAQLTVHFTSEQVSVMRDKSGAIVGGDPSEIHPAEDDWVFERDTTSKNPNWKIIET